MTPSVAAPTKTTITNATTTNNPQRTRKRRTEATFRPRDVTTPTDHHSPAARSHCSLPTKETETLAPPPSMTMTITVTTTNNNNNNHNNHNNIDNKNDNKNDDSSSKLSSVYEMGACAVCHCALDYSDAAAFSPSARHEDYSDDDDNDSDDDEDSDEGDNTVNDENDDEKKEEKGNNKNGDDGTSSSPSEYIYRKDDPYLPKVGDAIPTTATTKITTMTNERNNKDNIIPVIYQPNNALVYCDTCHRWYHQMCHFVPIYVLPSSAFTCLLCQYQMEQQKKTSKKQKLKPRPTSKPQSTRKFKKDLVVTVEYPIQSMFQSPPITNHCRKNHPILYYESLWENDPVVVLKKSKGLSDQLQTLVRRITHTTMANLRRTKGTIDTYLFQSSQHTRNYHLGIKSSSSTSTMNAATSKRLGKKKTKSNHQIYLSQELVQCIVGYTTAKYTIRTLLQSLEFSRNTPLQRQSWAALIAWCTNDDNRTENDADAADRLRLKLDFVQRIIFPFGNQHERRWIPLTPEYPLDYPNLHYSVTTPTHVPASSIAMSTVATVPSEIHIRPPNRNSTHNDQAIKMAAKAVKNGVHSERTASPNRRKSSYHGKNDKKKKTKKDTNLNKNDNDDDSGISLHDLKCCVCFCGECSDENDLLMCDGQNCYRAFHMRCLYPPVENVDESDDSDWFCPYCQTIAELLLKVQTETNRILRHDDDDEWERRRYIRYQQQRKAAIRNSTKKGSPTLTHKSMPFTTADDNDSLKSWEDIDQDVFPEAEWEYNVAQRLKKQRGLRNHLDIEILLARIQGHDEQRVIAMYQRQQQGDDHQDPTADNIDYAEDDDDDDDDDNLDVDGNFDMYSYQEERRLSRADHDDEDDDTNSQFTLAELSVVELNVSDDELAALTDIESDDDDDTEGETSANQSLHQRCRQSRRLRDKQEKSTKTSVRKKNKNGLHSEKFSDNDDTGRMDVANIIVGKRKRGQIDYRKLNDMLFHAIPASELDDDDDFIYTDPHHKQQQQEHSSTEKTHKATTATTTTTTATTANNNNNNNTNHNNAKKTTTLARKKSTHVAKSTKTPSKVPPKRRRR